MILVLYRVESAHSASQSQQSAGRRAKMAATPAKIEGAVPKKVYMHYDEGDEALHLTLKITLPSKWAGHTVDYLKEVSL